MGEKKDKKEPKREDYGPGTLRGELDCYDNVIKPINDALKAAEDWKKENGDKK